MTPRAHAFLTLVLLLQDVQACTNVKSLSQQLDSLLAEYDRESPPAHPALVQLTFDLHHISIQANGVVHSLVDLVMVWEDPRITWNSSEWGCDHVLTSADRLWMPDADLLNGVGGSTQAALDVRVTSSGQIQAVRRLEVSVPVALDLSDWPEDTQTVIFKFGSQSRTMEELTYEVKKNVVAVYEAGEWQLLGVMGQATRSGGRQVASFAVRVRRRAGARAAAAAAVLLTVSLTLAAALALPPIPRAPLCACTSLTATIWLVSVAAQTGVVGTAPSAVSAVAAVCACGGAAAAGACLVSRLASLSARPPRKLSSLASYLSRWCNLAPHQDCSPVEVGAWAALAQLLDYALAAVLLVVLFVSICIYM